MNADLWTDTTRITAVFAGIFFGSAAIYAAGYVWMTKQAFGFGGSALSATGVALSGLSIWGSTALEPKPGVDLKLQTAIEQKVETAANKAADAVIRKAKLALDKTAAAANKNIEDHAKQLEQRALAEIHDNLKGIQAKQGAAEAAGHVGHGGGAAKSPASGTSSNTRRS